MTRIRSDKQKAGASSDAKEPMLKPDEAAIRKSLDKLRKLIPVSPDAVHDALRKKLAKKMPSSPPTNVPNPTI